MDAAVAKEEAVMPASIMHGSLPGERYSLPYSASGARASDAGIFGARERRLDVGRTRYDHGRKRSGSAAGATTRRG